MHATDLAKNQRDIGVAEFFARNRHLLGFDNKTKALMTTIKEAVACIFFFWFPFPSESVDCCSTIQFLERKEGFKNLIMAKSHKKKSYLLYAGLTCGGWVSVYAISAT
jgi:hypothetical protein